MKAERDLLVPSTINIQRNRFIKWKGKVTANQITIFRKYLLVACGCSGGKAGLFGSRPPGSSNLFNPLERSSSPITGCIVPRRYYYLLTGYGCT